MATEKDAAKRRRQARNRQERTKRQTRVEAAGRSGSSRPARTPDAVASKTKRSTASRGARGGAAQDRSSDTVAPANPISSGGLLGKLFPPRPAPGQAKGTGGRPSRAQPSQSVVVDVEEAGGVRGWMVSRMSQPGGRPTMLALFVAIVSAITLLALPVVPRYAFEGYGETVVVASAEHAGRTQAQVDAMVDTFTGGDPISNGTLRLAAAAPLAYALVFSLIPLVISALAVASLTKPTRSRTLLISALAGAMYVFLSRGSGVFFVLGVLALGFGAYKSRKADQLAAAGGADPDED